MGKQTKRARKFEASGGVKGRLDKGTITNKGRMKRMRKKGGANAPDEKTLLKAKAHADAQLNQERRKKAESDFTSNDNVGDLDLESFFEKTVGELGEQTNEEEDMSSDEENEEMEGAGPSKKAIKDDSDDDSEDSDDEDVEAAAEKMQLEMDKLSKSDPDFHKYLQENEQSLLDFEAEEEDDEMDDDDEEDDDEPKSKNEAGKNVVQVTPEFLQKIVQGTFKSHGVKGLKKLVQIYKAACHLSDTDQTTDEQKGKKIKYNIDSRKIFDEVMVMALTQCHEEFTYHLVGKGAQDPKQSKKKDKKKKDDDDEEDEDDDAFDENAPMQPKKLMRSYRWKEMYSILQTFFKATMHVLTESKDPGQLTFILKALGKYIPFLTPMPRIAQLLLRSLVNLWSAPLDISEDYQVVRLNAFIRIRQMAITQPFPFIEECLKKTYLAYAKRAKYGTSATVTSVLPTLTFMGNCIVELYSLDFHSSYQHAFVYIRQLALHLRTALQKKTPESFQVVYCWQYIHCLKLWTAVLVQSCKMAKDMDSSKRSEADLLQSLIFPLTEVIQGVVRLVPTTRHLPLRLHCVRYLQQLASASERFVPTTSILLEALELKEISQKPKKDKSKSLSKGTQLALIIKLPKENTLRTAEQLEACVGEIFLLLNREAELYRYSPAFSEFQVLICQRLRKFNKTTKNGRFRAYSKGCIDMCERYANFCKQERGKLLEAPKDIKRLEALKPSGEPSMAERYEAAIAKEKRLEEAARPAAKNKQQPTKKRSLEDDDDEKAPKVKKQRKPRKVMPQEAPITAEEALEQEDEVAEGVNWSDDENDDMDE
jgi:nucleolar complex protein 2